MVTFVCNVCQESLKRSKINGHFYRCPDAYFACVDCSKDFYGQDYSEHTQCISEAEKYQKSLYQPKKGKQNNASNTNVKGNQTPNAKISPANKVQGNPKANGKPVARPAAPKSFVEEMKTSEAQKRKQVDLSQETAAKKVKPTSTTNSTVASAKDWSAVELKCEVVGAINQSMKAVLAENDKPLPLAKLRKKTVKKLMEHPRNAFTKETIKNAFDKKVSDDLYVIY
ncbi:hypothetical protein IWQ61_000836 [Dispira simplex]|nr:hypothetical protein IWQ61_000836 [Dispira simplex]